jgi:RNA 3'-terminal phosphate cyclase
MFTTFGADANLQVSSISMSPVLVYHSGFILRSLIKGIGLQLVAGIASGILDGVQTGSSKISFLPGQIELGEYISDPGTAGSTTLLLQISLPCLIFAPNGENDNAPSILTLRGGTASRLRAFCTNG